jgi:hypothetical protein
VIVGAAVLVLLGLGLFVAGILTGLTALYWACVAACVVAAVLLVLVRRQSGTKTAEAPKATEANGTPKAAEPAETPGTAESSPTEPTAEADASTSTDAPAAETPEAAPAEDLPDPEVEEVEVTDLLLVVDLKDEVLVVDEHPRYHVAECAWLAGRETIPLPLDEARTDGFTPCAVCSPDRTLAERARARKSSGASQPEA